jgi:hypothetical protein
VCTRSTDEKGERLSMDQDRSLGKGCIVAVLHDASGKFLSGFEGERKCGTASA